MEQQLGALLQVQQMMQQNMLELMNHFASDKSEKKKVEQLDWRALGEMQQFKGGEPDDEEGHDVRGGEHQKGPGCDLR